MAKFLLVHPLEGPFDPEVGTPMAKAVKACCNADAYWIRSSIVPGASKMYCEWEAKDSQAVLDAVAAAARITPQLPVEGIYEIAMQVSGEEFR
jgi:hypothetical protein